MPVLYPRNLLSSCAPAHEPKCTLKQIAQGVLSAESGTHECQSAGAIPTHPSKPDLILASEIAPFYVFYLLPDTFLGKTFRARIWPVLESGITAVGLRQVPSELISKILQNSKQVSKSLS